MITIVLATALGIVFTLLATENSQNVTLSIIGNSITLPFFIIIAISFLAGTLVTSILSLFDWTAAAFDIKKKENSYNNVLKINDELRERVQKTDKEVLSLKQELESTKAEINKSKNTKRKEEIKNFFSRIA